jgi:hypothetical protein
MAVSVIKTGNSTLDNVFPTIISEIRWTMQVDGIVEKLVDRATMKENTGTAYLEAKLAASTAYDLDEGEPFPDQVLTDTSFTVTPAEVGLKLAITSRHLKMATRNMWADLSKSAARAMAKKKDEKLISNFDNFSTSNPGAGNALTAGGFRAYSAVVRTGGNVEPAGNQPIYAVLHPYQADDLMLSIMGGFSSGNAVADTGISAEVLRNYFVTKVFGVEVYWDQNIAIDSSDDCKGAIFAKEALKLVDFQTPETRSKEDFDTRSMILYAWADYGYAEWLDGWGYEVYSDILAPTG